MAAHFQLAFFSLHDYGRRQRTFHFFSFLLFVISPTNIFFMSGQLQLSLLLLGAQSFWQADQPR
jgi:hypothetical protein